ncbi:alpha/beta fold hydrolase, partial [Nocardia tengchongensis]|uniref:alpha/beta fold hydrolase n=1 Tax=Nocardia tengchongensis TaxID=2055889 RepID=UPI00369DE41A
SPPPPGRREPAPPGGCAGGAPSQVNRPEGGPMLAESMPNCDLYLAANTGHWVQWERAELFNTLAAAFLEGSS